jgi:hypothetical protein
MNLDHAISAHLAWKLALRQAVQTRVATHLDPEVLGRIDRCELGLWLASPAARFEGVEELRTLHAHFHAVAGELIHRLQQAGTLAETRGLAGDLEDISARLVVCLGTAARIVNP